MDIKVEVWESREAERSALAPVPAYGCITVYTMDHDDQAQRRVLGEQCRNAFEAGQCVITSVVEA